MTPLEVLEWASERTDLDVIAICDHNTNEGALEASRLAKDFPIEVIVAQEVESLDGHILGLWTNDCITPHRSAADTIEDIHAQGGLAVIAHPFAPRAWHKHGICRGDRNVYDTHAFDAIEVANSTPLLFFANFHARAYWRENHGRLAATGGSDAHILRVLGSSRTYFPGETAEDLRRALVDRTTRGWGPSFSPLRGFHYARKARQIHSLNRIREVREAERGISKPSS